ncbi:MAG TPA: PAS domain S-box protein [Geothrix sp.]|nr:PAS domain S-box protein [Geothrix sp.]
MGKALPKARLHDPQAHRGDLENQKEVARLGQADIDPSSAELAELYDFAQVGYFTLSQAGKILDANLRFCDMLQATKNSLIKRMLTSYVHAEDKDLCLLKLNQLVQALEPVTWEVRLKRLDSAPSWARLKATKTVDADGQAICRAVATNITEELLVDQTCAFLSRCDLLTSGEDFFRALLQHLAQSLGLDYACISRLESAGAMARTVALYLDGQFRENKAYRLKRTPCGDLTDRSIHCIPQDAHRLYPQDPVIQLLAAEGYIGVILLGAGGAPLGLLEAAKRKPLADPHLAQTLMNLVAMGTAGELQRKLTGDQLRDSEARTHSMLRMAFDGIWLLDVDGTFLDASESVLVMSGYTREELVGLRVSDIEATESSEETRSHIRRLMQSGFERFVSVHRRKDGSKYPVEISATYLPDQNQIVAFVRDDTERQEAHEAIREYQQHLEELIAERTKELEARNAEIFELYNQAPCGYQSLKADGTFTAINDTGLRMIGYSREQVINRLNIRNLLTPESLPRFEEGLRNHLKTGHAHWEIELEVLRKDGSVLPVLFRSNTIQDGNGRILGSRSTLVENGDRKRAEMLEKTSREDLERLVLERTAQLRHLALEATQAEERERRSIAHLLHDDLGQLLLVAKLKLHALAKTDSGLPYQALIGELDTLLAEANRMVRSLTSQLSPPVLETLGLIPALRNLVKDMEGKFGTTISLVDDDQPKSLSLPQSVVIYRAVQELLINVIKHSGLKEARIQTLCSDGHLVVIVEDKGIGMGDLDRVLMTTKGFGLRSIRERIVQLGGSMKAQAIPGDGTIVTLTIQLSPGPAPEATS